MNLDVYNVSNLGHGDFRPESTHSPKYNGEARQSQILTPGRVLILCSRF